MQSQVQLIVGYYISRQLDSRYVYKLARMAWSCCNSMDSVGQINLRFSKKCGAAMKTFSKWIANNDKNAEYNEVVLTMTKLIASTRPC